VSGYLVLKPGHKQKKDRKMNIQQKAAHNKVARDYVLELGLHATTNTHAVIKKILEAKTTDQKLMALDYLLKTITENKR
jgi:hypothetical protein